MRLFIPDGERWQKNAGPQFTGEKPLADLVSGFIGKILYEKDKLPENIERFYIVLDKEQEELLDLCK